MDELIRLVAQRARSPDFQLALAVSAMLFYYMTEQLPSALLGPIREELGETKLSRQRSSALGAT